MVKLQKICVVMIVCALFFAFGSASVEVNEGTKKPSFTERLTCLLYVSSPTSSSSSMASSPSYWEKVKALVNQVRGYYFPPNLDFRGSEEDEPVAVTGAGEKVKSAAAKSIEKGKEAVTSSAKSAAEMAGQTVQKTKEKAKKSLSSRETQEL